MLNKYLVARVFAFDDHESEARAACVAKGWEDVRRGPLWLVPLVKAKNKIDPLYAGTKHKVDPDYAAATSLTPSKLAVSPDHSIDLYGFGGRLGPVRKSEFSKDGSLLAVVGFNHNIALYDAATGNQRLVPRRAPEPATPS